MSSATCCNFNSEIVCAAILLAFEPHSVLFWCGRFFIYIGNELHRMKQNSDNLNSEIIDIYV